jgi:hypothetical protein
MRSLRLECLGSGLAGPHGPVAGHPANRRPEGLGPSSASTWWWSTRHKTRRRKSVRYIMRPPASNNRGSDQNRPAPSVAKLLVPNILFFGNFFFCFPEREGRESPSPCLAMPPSFDRTAYLVRGRLRVPARPPGPLPRVLPRGLIRESHQCLADTAMVEVRPAWLTGGRSDHCNLNEYAGAEPGPRPCH